MTLRATLIWRLGPVGSKIRDLGHGTPAVTRNTRDSLRQTTAATDNSNRISAVFPTDWQFAPNRAAAWPRVRGIVVFRGADYTGRHERCSAFGQTPCSAPAHPETDGGIARCACPAQDGGAQDGGRKSPRGSCCAGCGVACARASVLASSASAANVATAHCRRGQACGSFSPTGFRSHNPGQATDGCARTGGGCSDPGGTGCRTTTNTGWQRRRNPAAP